MRTHIGRDIDGRSTLHPSQGCTDAVGVARVPKLGQPPQTLDCTGSSCLLGAARALLDSFGGADRCRAFTGLIHTLPAHTMPTSLCSRGSANEISNSCCSKLVSLFPHTPRLEPTADFRQIGQSSVRETAPDRDKSFPYAMAVVRASDGGAMPSFTITGGGHTNISQSGPRTQRKKEKSRRWWHLPQGRNERNAWRTSLARAGVGSRAG